MVDRQGLLHGNGLTGDMSPKTKGASLSNGSSNCEFSLRVVCGVRRPPNELQLACAPMGARPRADYSSKRMMAGNCLGRWKSGSGLS